MVASPLLSVVTISFNQGNYLREAVESVLSQKGLDVEYIVVDPGSTDGSRDILAAYGAAIDHLVLESDKGPADGLNKGFARATGRYGYFINSDDFLLPGAIDHLRTLWQRHANADALLCGGWMVDGEGRPLREARPMPVDLLSLVHRRTTIVQHGFSFRMGLLREIGGFNPVNRTCWDYELLCAMARRKARFQVCPNRIGAFRLYGACLSGGVGGSAHLARYREDLDRIYQSFTGQAPGRLSRLQQAAGPWLKHLRHPSLAVGLVVDWLDPRRRDRRWQADRRGAGGGDPWNQ
jgi:glycosyltransferase involved in cell wall biosynthesis